MKTRDGPNQPLDRWSCAEETTIPPILRRLRPRRAEATVTVMAAGGLLMNEDTTSIKGEVGGSDELQKSASTQVKISEQIVRARAGGASVCVNYYLVEAAHDYSRRDRRTLERTALHHIPPRSPLSPCPQYTWSTEVISRPPHSEQRQ